MTTEEKLFQEHTIQIHHKIADLMEKATVFVALADPSKMQETVDRARTLLGNLYDIVEDVGDFVQVTAFSQSRNPADF